MSHKYVNFFKNCQEVALSESCSIGVGIWTNLNLYYIFVFRVPKEDDISYIL